MAIDTGLSTRLKQAQEHREGSVARTIEHETAKVPSDTFLWSALGVVGLSVGLFSAGKKADAMFVGQLATPLLALGIYNKLVKVGGSDRTDG
jgi:hypothetical protein